jgi:hypothetical protein
MAACGRRFAAPAGDERRVIEWASPAATQAADLGNSFATKLRFSTLVFWISDHLDS